MCTYGESIYYSARKEALLEGREVGREEGRVEGREEGFAEAMLLSIRNLMGSLKISAQEAMNKLQVPEEERETYESLLKQ